MTMLRSRKSIDRGSRGTSKPKMKIGQKLEPHSGVSKTNEPIEVVIGSATVFGTTIPLIAKEGYFGLKRQDIIKSRKIMRKLGNEILSEKKSVDEVRNREE